MLTTLRASYFSYISSTSYVVSFLGPTIASFTMSWNLWLPFWINIVLLTCAFPVIRMLPEPTNSQVKTLATVESADMLAEVAESLLEEQVGSAGRFSKAFETHPGLFQSIVHALQKMRALLTGRRNFQVLLVSFFLTALASSDTKLLVQYISKRYEWTFAQAGYMLSAKAIVNFTLLALVVPRIIKSSMSTKAVHGSEVRLNYLGAEISILVSVIGVLCVALAFKFWMLLAGEFEMALHGLRYADHTSFNDIRARIGAASVHYVACQITAYSACEFRYTRLQHRHVDEDPGIACWGSSYDSAVGPCYQAWWSWSGIAVLCLCSRFWYKHK